MILPGSQLSNLILLVFGIACLGSWTNTLRMTPKWRFELYYFDFAIGAMLAALLIGFTLGSLGWDGFGLLDDLRIAGKRQEALAASAGVVFNLGNMLILGALSVAGVTVAYLIGVGIMLAVGSLILYFVSPSGSGTVLAGGVALILGCATLVVAAFRMNAMTRLMALVREGKTKSTKKVVSTKGPLLAMAGGLVASACFPLVQSARSGEDGLGPYALSLVFAGGMFVSTLIFNLFFMNLPVQGDPLDFGAWFQGKVRFHALGLAGGALWYIGLESILIVVRAEGSSVVSPVIIRALVMTSVVIGAGWGLMRWKEFAGAERRIKVLLVVAMLLFVAGAAGISLAPDLSSGG